MGFEAGRDYSITNEDEVEVYRKVPMKKKPSAPEEEFPDEEEISRRERALKAHSRRWIKA